MNEGNSSKKEKETITIEDLAGNKSRVTINTNPIDKTAPVITGIEEGRVYKGDVIFGIIEPNLANVIIDEKTYNAKNFPNSIREEGNHTISVIDKSGNTTTINFSIDTTPAKAKILYEEISPKTEDFKAVMTTNEEIETPEGWTRVDEKTYTKDYKKEKPDKDPINNKKVFKIIGYTIFVVALLVILDLLLITRLNMGPFLAIRTKVHDDGGTKEYYGLGYKVIKYNQTEGRKDTKVGLWTMKFTNTPTPITTMDFALNYINNTKQTYKKYYGQYVTLTDSIHILNKETKTITFDFHDADGKYNFQIDAVLADDEGDIANLKVGDKVKIVGTILDYKDKTKVDPYKVIIKNVYIK